MFVEGNLVDIHLQEIYPARLVISKNRIIEIIRVNKKLEGFILPGFIDAHVHIESSLLSPIEFGRIALSHGTIGVVSDPHEIANVCGVDGVCFMIEEGRRSRLKFNWTAPSCVPATEMETSGAVLDDKDIEFLLGIPEIVALGEMMNFPGVINGDELVLKKCALAGKFNKVIDGHAPGLSGDKLAKYISYGISSDHECSTIDEALEKINLGMRVLIREGSSAKNFRALFPLMISHAEKVMLCSDDLHADDLIRGHINLLVKRSLELGIPLFNILKIVTQNPVEFYGLPIGMLRMNDFADFIFVDNLTDFNILQTWVDGVLVERTDDFCKLFKLKRTINNFNASHVEESELVIVPSGKMCRVIEVEDGELSTKASFFPIGKNFDYFLHENEIQKLFVKNRYDNSCVSKALVKGFGPMKGAFASSVAHDSHNIIAIGDDLTDVSNAINEVISHKGGISYSIYGESLFLALPIGGLMSDDSAEDVSARYLKISEYIREHGCRLNSPVMTLSFLALLVIPELKLSDKGLFDFQSFSFTNTFFD